MRFRFPLFQLCLLVAFVATGCDGHQVEQGEPSAVGGADSVLMPLPHAQCGRSELVDLQSTDGFPTGMFEVSNDSAYLYMTYAPLQSCTMNSIAIYYGDLAGLPRDAQGKPDPTKFPLHYNELQERNARTMRVAWESLPDCILVTAYIELSKNGQPLTCWTSDLRDTLKQPGIAFCRQTCADVSPPCDLADPAKHPTTLVQEQWNAAEGREASHLLRTHFAELFPEGLTLGCNHKVTYHSAEEILSMLPMTAPATALLPGAKPEQARNNRLAGELLSLQAVIRLDELLPAFTPGSQPLPHLQVGIGAFEGWTVQEILLEGNSVLGGCTSNYTPDQIQEVVHEINICFAAGSSNSTFLRCPID